ncbi:sugar ABC transporter ATP-binding protein [Tessaracoccus sp. MC1756]|uniref:sugar ABC transporter ATP-binding protein n=1 Tax=Tessaracoccus sp. MC1756 TaxID=2760311 RepID=UPI001602AAB2|nr:sugar ABC transporter ATP-binding protein [Tessaracoccus sp. MC1756]MBB1510881.1 sugar ABC transporter ATP-binding protein [Tessaracoccus sp. MC1756]
MAEHDLEKFLTFDNVSKDYAGVPALAGASWSVRRGEVHGLVGENGAGKSTLIKTLAGAIRPTSGDIIIDGERLDHLTPRSAIERGIAVIYQEFTLVSELTVAENIFLGMYPLRGGLLDRKDMITKTVEILSRLKVAIDPQKPVRELTTGYQQIVEIAKALARDARVLVMDEPSAPLTMHEVEAMVQVVQTLASEGVTIIYISHRLEEIFRLTDRVTVLRDGRIIKTLFTGETDRNELIQLMVGRSLSATYPEREAHRGHVGLELRGLTGNGVEDISFSVHHGEIIGLGGLVGAGRTEVAKLLFGLEPIEGGDIEVEGRPFLPTNVRQAIQAGVALVPEDRKREGAFVHLPIRENMILPSIRRLSTLVFRNRKREAALVERFMGVLHVRARGADQLVNTLSGGNQQKVVLAKWLAMDPAVLIFDEPTRGIDVGAKHEIYELMNELAARGKAIVMISSEMEELMGMSDRIVVLSRGRNAGILERAEYSQERILSMASGE